MTAWWLTWLWQGLALTLATSAAFRLLPRVNAATRYWIWWSTLGALAALGLSAVAPLGAKADATHLLVVPSAPDPLIVIALGVWAAVAIFGFLRVIVGVRAVCALRDRCRSFPAGLEAQLPLWLEAGGRGRRARLMLCDAVDGAKMLGFGPACIALPSSLVRALTPEELDQIVLHEYAHVQRWDDWTRLAQMLLQSALWIHPAIALVGRHMNLEREVACDEWVVARTARPNAYARCLARAAEMRGTATGLMLGSALFGPTRHLVQRVDRLLALEGRVRPNVSALAAVAGACALVAISLELRAFPLVAEVGETVFPAFAASPLRRGEPAVVRLTAFADAAAVEKPHATYEPFESASAPDGTPADKLDAPDANAPLASAFAPDGATADKPDAPLAPVLLARTFNGHYQPGAASSTPDAPRPWHKAEAAGIKIAQTFTRAGVSLARRF